MEDVVFLFDGTPIKVHFSFFSKNYFKGYFSKNIEKNFSIVFKKKTFLIQFDKILVIQKINSFYIEAKSSSFTNFYHTYMTSFSYKELYQMITSNQSSNALNIISSSSQDSLWKVLKKEVDFTIKPIWKQESINLLHYNIFMYQDKYAYILRYQGIPTHALLSSYDFSEYLPNINCIQALFKEVELSKRMLCNEREAILAFKRRFNGLSYAINDFSGSPCLFTNITKENSSQHYCQSSTLDHFEVLDSLEKRPLDLAYYIQGHPNFWIHFTYLISIQNLSIEQVDEYFLSLDRKKIRIAA